MWRAIKGYEGLYEIDENADVWRLGGCRRAGIATRQHRVAISRTRHGQLYVALWKGGMRKNFMLHKLYADTFSVSDAEAKRRVYLGFRGDIQAPAHVKKLLREDLRMLRAEETGGMDRHDEILYLEQFIGQLEEIDSATKGRGRTDVEEDSGNSNHCVDAVYGVHPHCLRG